MDPLRSLYSMPLTQGILRTMCFALFRLLHYPSVASIWLAKPNQYVSPSVRLMHGEMPSSGSHNAGLQAQRVNLYPYGIWYRKPCLVTMVFRYLVPEWYCKWTFWEGWTSHLQQMIGPCPAQRAAQAWMPAVDQEGQFFLGQGPAFENLMFACSPLY